MDSNQIAFIYQKIVTVSHQRRHSLNFRALQNYTVEFVRYDDSSTNHVVTHQRIRFLAPSHYRIDDLQPRKESIRAAEGHVDHLIGCMNLTQISNGKIRWTYNAERKQYSQFEQIKDDPKVEFFPSPITNSEVESLPEETLLLGGPCTALRCSPCKASKWGA